MRLARSVVWALWRKVRYGVYRGGASDGVYDDDPPDRGAGSEIRTLRLESLSTFRDDAKVLADRLRVTPGQLWGSGVRVGVAESDGGDVLMEFADGTVLAARRVDPAGHPSRVRLRVEPTKLPLLLE